MSPPTTVTAPSPLPNQMGSILHDGGCTFRVWAIFADAMSVKIWDTATTTRTIALARDTAVGYGAVWSVFVPDVAEETNYRFVVSNSGSTYERVDPFARSIVFPNWTDATQDDSDARSVVTSQNFDWGPVFQAPGWRELVIYQLHIGTFFDPSQGGASKIDDLIAQIPYLTSLGVNAIQFLPFIEFSAALSLGYDPVLPYAMERDYGKPQDFKRLVKALHAAGMRVLVDVVYNHIDVSSWPSQRLFPYSLYQYDGWPGNPCGIYFYGGDEINTPWGPRPDYGRDQVRQYLIDNTAMWMNDYQVDGIRFDSTLCMRKRQGPCGDHCCGSDLGVGRNFGWELMQSINDNVNRDQPWKLTIAEDLDSNAAITAPTSSGGAGFAAQWDMDLQGALMWALTQGSDSSIDVGTVADRIQHPFEGDFFKRIIYLESHDQADNGRVPDRIKPGDAEGWYARKKSMLGFAVVLTTPGIPMFFQGAEILDYRRWSETVMMDWTRPARFPNLFRFYADMVRFRKNTAGLCGAGLNVFQANPSTKVLAYHRWNQGSGGDDVVVVANFSGTSFPSYTIGFPYSGTWYLRLNSDANVYSDSNDFGSVNSYDTTASAAAWDSMPYSGNVGIGPYSLIVLTR